MTSFLIIKTIDYSFLDVNSLIVTQIQYFRHHACQDRRNRRPREAWSFYFLENISIVLYPVCVTPHNSSHYKIPESLWSNLVIQCEAFCGLM
jgi:hypothetical protein